MRSKWLMVGALVVAVLMGAGRIGSGLVDRTGTDPVPEINCSEAIAWDEATEYVGDEVTVSGPVVGSAFAENVAGRPTFLNLGKDHPDPDRFTIVIWNDVRTQISGDPELLFGGREVCVAGEIQMHEGSPQIELAGPAAIEIAD